MTTVVPIESIVSKIIFLRSEKVLLDLDLAQLYGVETKQLKRAVRRNIDRFPPDFMFELTKEEYDSLRYQFGTLKRGEHSKYLPMAFTEQGVAMLSSVLKSKSAIEVNIAIMRACGNREVMSPRLGTRPSLLAFEQGPTVSYVCILTARGPAWTLGARSRCFRGLTRLYGAAAGGSPSTEGRADDCGSASHTCLHGYSLGGAVPCTCPAFHAGVPICNPSMPVTHNQHLVRAHHGAHATSHALFFV